MFKFIKSLFKKKKKKVPRIFSVPDCKKEEFISLYDNVILETDKHINLKMATYKLWRYIESLYPETKIGYWRFGIEGTRIVVIEIIKE